MPNLFANFNYFKKTWLQKAGIVHGLIVMWLMEKWYENYAINLLEVGVFLVWKKTLAGVRGQVKPCDAPSEVLGVEF